MRKPFINYNKPTNLLPRMLLSNETGEGNNTFSSTLYQSPVDLAAPYNSSQPTTQESMNMSSQQEFLDICLRFDSLGHECTEDPNASWLLEGPGYASPFSTTSSISPSDGLSTPPPSNGQQSVATYDLPNPAYHTVPTSNQQAWSENAQSGWQGHLVEGNAWAPQVLQYWNENTYGSFQSEPIDSSYHPTSTESTPEPFEYLAANNYIPFPADTAPFRAEMSADLEVDDSDENASDTSGSEYQEDDPTPTRQSMRGCRNASSVLKLGKWMDASFNPEARHYACPFSNGRPDPSGRVCSQRFVRPEHLRRHIKTVHGSDKNFVCKVAKCRRAFSRGDNLRDHYWTHISRGGRSGRNEKMTFNQLKDILGPKERKLVKRLRQRFITVRAKL